jgi:hypothetical protein
MLLLTIILPVVALVLGFWLGTRYTGRVLLPVILAKMSDKELGDLAKRTDKERQSR